MPLYSVTCGDIGTKSEIVENYLRSVFALGKKWNCGLMQWDSFRNKCANQRAVLLLDEADVFLEERTLSDLKRNSLVSGLNIPNFTICGFC